MKNFFTVVWKVFLCVACRVFLSIVSNVLVVRVVLVVYHESYTKFIVKDFLYVGFLGFTRPIQDYGSGPGTPLAYK